MTNRDAFTTDEWKILELAPGLVWAMVASADGKVDRKEIDSFSLTLAQSSSISDPLMRAAVTSLAENMDTLYPTLLDAARPEIVGKLKRASTLLANKATKEEAASFKRALLQIGQNTAQASGGLLRILRNNVSGAERQALSLISAALEESA